MAPTAPEPASLAVVNGLTLGELSARTGVPVSTIHHYRARGVLPPPSGPRGQYGEVHVRALRLVRLLREQRGLSLDAIASMLPALLAHEHEAFQPAMWDRILQAQTTDDPVRAALVDGTLAELARRSLDELTVADLCAAAGVGKSTFYRYFDGKEAAFLAAADAAADRVAVALTTPPAGEQPEFATRLRDVLAPVLPVLLELAMRASRGAPSFAVAAASVFDRIAMTIEADPGSGADGVTALAQAATDLVTAVFDSVS